MMYETIEKITTIDKHDISLHIFSPTNVNYQESTCDGVILAVHGLSEHIDRYQHLAEITCKKNKIFACFNVRGHGKEALKKGDVQNFSCLILDIIFAYNTLKKLFTNVKQNSFAIFGHSFGGVQVTYAASILLQEVKKIFICAPGYAVKQKIPTWKVMLANNLYLLLPELLVPIDFNPAWISNNPVNNENYKKDSQILKRLSVRFGKIIFDAMDEEQLNTVIKNITAKVTFLLAGDDQLVDTAFTKKLLQGLKTKACVYEIKNAGHECFNETQELQQKAFAYFEEWLDTI